MPERGACADLHKLINQRIRTGINTSSIKYPASTLFLGDYGWWGHWVYDLPHYQSEWHGKRCNFNLAFLDGHVESLKIEKGPYFTSKYRVLPFTGRVETLARACSQQKPCPQ